MDSSRTENARKNIFFGYINKIVSLILPFVVRTVMLYTLGSQYLGLGSLFSSILQMLNMADLGFSSAIVFSLYKPLAEDNEEIVCGLITFFKRIYRILGLIIFVVGIALIPLLDKLISGTVPNDINIYIIYFIYLINTCFSYWFFAYKSSLLQASQKTRVASNIQTIVIFIQYSLQIFILYATKSYYLFIIVLPIATIINNFIVARRVDRLFPRYIKNGFISMKDKRDLKIQIKGLAITKICGVMRDSADNIVISAFVGLTAVAVFSNYFYIISAVHGILTVITSSIRAGIGNSIATESVEKNTKDLFKFSFLYYLIYNWCFVCIICLYQDFMRIWVCEELILPNATMILFAVYFYLLSSTDIRNTYIEAKGLWWEYRIRAIIETIANLFLNILFVYYFGIFGIILATIMTFFVINIVYGNTILFNKYFGKDKLKKYYFQRFLYVLVTIIISIVIYSLSGLVHSNNIISFAIKAVSVALTVIFIEFLLFFKNKYFKDFLNSIFKRKNRQLNIFSND